MILARSTRPRLLRLAFLTGASFLIVPSCGDDSATGTGTGGGSASSSSGGADDENIVFEGEASDEGYREMKAVAPLDEPTQGSTFTAPTDGAKLAAAEPTTFSWQVGGGDSSVWPVPSNAAQTTGAQPGDAFMTFLLAGVREAHAHGDPTQGVAHLLTFEDAAGSVVLEVFTTEASFTPDAETWASLAAAADPLAASLVTATYESNRIVSGGGPFAGQRIQFSIE